MNGDLLDRMIARVRGEASVLRPVIPLDGVVAESGSYDADADPSAWAEERPAPPRIPAAAASAPPAGREPFAAAPAGREPFAAATARSSAAPGGTPQWTEPPTRNGPAPAPLRAATAPIVEPPPPDAEQGPAWIAPRPAEPGGRADRAAPAARTAAADRTARAEAPVVGRAARFETRVPDRHIAAEPEPPVVRLTVGRLEVRTAAPTPTGRADQSQATSDRPATPPVRRRPGVSLDEYLRRRETRAR